jgi:hypothetical protein
MHERLFHKAIIESGECTRTSGFIVSHQTALLRGAKFAAKAGCADAKTFAACLRSKTAAELLSASAGLDLSVANAGGSLMPTVPIELIESGELQRIPVIVGANHDEQKHNPVETTGFPATAETCSHWINFSRRDKRNSPPCFISAVYSRARLNSVNLGSLPAAATFWLGSALNSRTSFCSQV